MRATITLGDVTTGPHSAIFVAATLTLLPSFMAAIANVLKVIAVEYVHQFPIGSARAEGLQCCTNQVMLSVIAFLMTILLQLNLFYMHSIKLLSSVLLHIRD